MDTPLLVARAASGDLDSFGRLYDAEFGRVYDFVWRVTRDNGIAGDVTRGAFVAAAQHLREIAASGTDFHVWVLLAAARDALARLDGAPAGAPLASHEEAFGAFDVPDTCRMRDPGVLGGDAELACLVWEAAASLSPRDYALLDLHVRQGIDSAALAPLLSVPKGSARDMLGRLERAASDAMLTYVLVRRGGKDCEPLRRLLAEHGFPPYTDAVRTAVDAHAATCQTCSRTRDIGASPVEVLRGFLPVQAPFVLKGETWRELAAAWAGTAPRGAAPVLTSTAAGIAPADAVDAFTAGGPRGNYPPPAPGSGGRAAEVVLPYSVADAEDGRRTRTVILFIAAGSGMLLVAFLVAGLALGAFGSGGGGGGSGSGATQTTSASGTAAGPGVTLDTPSPAPSPSVTSTPTETAVPPPTSTPPPATATATPSPAGPRTATPTRTPVVRATPTPGGPPTPTVTPPTP